MRNPTRNRNQNRLLRKITAAGLALVVVLAGLPSCAIRPRTDWLRVQAVPPKQKTEVRLYKDAAPPESRRIKGRFDSATDDSVTLVLKDGQTRTVEKQAVRRILTRRPFIERWPGWVALGASLLTIQLPWDMGKGSQALILFAVPTSFFFGSQLGPIYDVPPRHRTRLQGDQQPPD